MNKQLMKKHYEATPRKTLIEILVKSREENKRLNNIINELEKWLFDNKNCVPKHITDYFEKLKGVDKD